MLRLAQKECFLYVLIFKCINRKLKCEYTYGYDFSFEEKYLIIGFQAFMFFERVGSLGRSRWAQAPCCSGRYYILREGNEKKVETEA